VALHSIRSDLSMALTGQVWIIDGYTLTFAALLLAGGGLANRYGARAVYVTGLAAFVAASSLCAGATSGADLIGARLLQGAAAALFIPSSLALLAHARTGAGQQPRGASGTPRRAGPDRASPRAARRWPLCVARIPRRARGARSRHGPGRP